MWYFSWILGLLLACSLGIINVLRLEAQEALAKETLPLDPLTHLLTQDSILPRLREKVENSKRNGAPFSIVFISLLPFVKQYQPNAHELEAVLRGVVEVLKQDIRIGLDLAARFEETCFLLTLTGAPLAKAKQVAATVKADVLANVKTSAGVAVAVESGAAEYLADQLNFGSDVTTSEQEVQALIALAQKECCKA